MNKLLFASNIPFVSIYFYLPTGYVACKAKERSKVIMAALKNARPDALKGVAGRVKRLSKSNPSFVKLFDGTITLVPMPSSRKFKHIEDVWPNRSICLELMNNGLAKTVRACQKIS